MVCFNLFCQALMMLKQFFNSFICVFEDAVCSILYWNCFQFLLLFRRYCQFFFACGFRAALCFNVFRHFIGIDPCNNTGTKYRFFCFFSGIESVQNDLTLFLRTFSRFDFVSFAVAVVLFWLFSFSIICFWLFRILRRHPCLSGCRLLSSSILLILLTSVL